MKFIIHFLWPLFLLLGLRGFSQDPIPGHSPYWQIGIGLGELPTGGSFKPSLTFGYHFNNKFYAGIIYQFKDHIQRDGNSFNAKSSGIEGLIASEESVAQRFLIHTRFTPIKNGPFLSAGIVFNGKDTEQMQFDDSERNINGVDLQGPISITQSRPAGWGMALGLGYQYDFKNGFSAGFEWTPAWGQYPEPAYTFSGNQEISEETTHYLEKKMNVAFKKSVTNMYKVFHLGLAYRFQ